MKKTILIGVGAFLGLLLLAIAGAPFWFGMETQKAYDNLVQQASKSGRFTVTGKSYHRGWLGSTAVMDVTSPGSPIAMSISHDISHGPIPIKRLLGDEVSFEPVLAVAKSKVTLSLTGASAGMLPALSLPPIEINTLLRFSGDGEFLINLPPTNKKTDDSTSIQWRGMSGNITFDADWKKFKMNLESPGLAVESDKGKFSVSNIRVDYDMYEGIAEYLFGGGSIYVAKMSFGSTADVSGFKLTTKAKPVGGNMVLTIGYHVKNITVAEEKYGPGQLEFELRNLSVKTLRQFEREINGLYKQDMPQEQASMIMLGKLMQLAADLSKQVPEMEVTKLSFKTKDGDINGKAKFILDGSQLNVSENPMLLITAFSGDAELAIPRDIVRSIVRPLVAQDIETYINMGALTAQASERLTPDLMNKVIDQAMPLYLPRNPLTRLLVEDGGHYKITASVRRGQFYVNDKPWQGLSPTL